jgi:hypothetical protein
MLLLYWSANSECRQAGRYHQTELTYSLVADLRSLKHVSSTCSRIRHCTDTQLTGGEQLRDQFVRLELDFRRVQAALEELKEGVKQLRDIQSIPVGSGDLAVVHRIETPLVEIIGLASDVNVTARESRYPLFTQGEFS